MLDIFKLFKSKSQLKIISYNAKWFFDNDDTQIAITKTCDMDEKINYIVGLLVDSKPDIICLQEVEGYNKLEDFKHATNNEGDSLNIGNNKYYSAVLHYLAKKFNASYKTKKVNIDYKYLIGKADRAKQRVGILINTKQITLIFTTVFKSKVGLKNISLGFSHNKIEYFLLNIHLKSKFMNNETRRADQATEITDILKNVNKKNIIICGDMNMKDPEIDNSEKDIDCYKIIMSGGDVINAWTRVDKNILDTYETHFYDKNRNGKVDKGELSIIDAFIVSKHLRFTVKPLIDLKLGDRTVMLSDHIPILLQI